MVYKYLTVGLKITLSPSLNEKNLIEKYRLIILHVLIFQKLYLLQG